MRWRYLTPRVADAPEEGDHARTADARKEVLQVHADDDTPSDVWRDEGAHAASGNETVGHIRHGNLREHFIEQPALDSFETGLGRFQQPPATAGLRNPPVMVVAEFRFGGTCIHPPLVR